MTKILSIAYTPSFYRQFQTLETQLQEETIEKISLFKTPANHKWLKVHKLKGPLSGRHSFSINYKFRIVFSYLSKNSAVFLAIGDHDIYK